MQFTMMFLALAVNGEPERMELRGGYAVVQDGVVLETHFDAPEPEPAAKTCPCSTQCTCGCNAGKPCDCGNVTATQPAQPAATVSVNVAVSGNDALDVVNSLRTQRGLRPFARDAGLSAAAVACATFRAARRIQGHTSSDFAFLPAGVSADAAGCAAWTNGFGACALYDNYQSAGAAWVRGADGLNYCHLFVRHGPPTGYGTGGSPSGPIYYNRPDDPYILTPTGWRRKAEANFAAPVNVCKT